MNQITVLFFATLRDKAGVRSIKMEVETGTTLGQLKLLLAARHVGLNGIVNHCLASINHEYRFDDDQIPEAAEVALFPPVSGG